MTEEQLERKLEWANKRCEMKGEGFTETQIDYLKFVFAGMVVEKIESIHNVSDQRELLRPFAVHIAKEECYDNIEGASNEMLDSFLGSNSR